MPYEITATRERPQGFEGLYGQEFVSTTLKASIASGRIAHAYLFAGPRGCGKTSTARILARALNCEKGPTYEPCGVCDSCVSIARGSALDVIEIDGASNTSVEGIRQIKDEVLFPPNSGKYKIYIIDEVHMLSNSAFNALLKTIEEPPPYIIFIFATTELHKVPATIKSRCQQFNFRLIPLETIRERLRAVCANLGVEADEDALLWISKEATGSLRDAYTLFDQVASFSKGRITSAKIRESLGLVGLERMNSLMERCIAGDRRGALEMMDGILAQGVSVEQFVLDAAEYCRSILLARCGVEREALLGAPKDELSTKVISALTPERAEHMLAGMFDLHRDIRYSVNPRFELDLAVSRLAAIADFITPSQISKTIGGLKSFLSGGALPMGIARESAERVQEINDGSGIEIVKNDIPSTATDASATITESGDNGVKSPPEPLASLKQGLAKALEKKSVVLSACVSRSGSWTLEGDRLRIECANGYDESTMRAELNLMSKKAAELAGRSMRIELRSVERESAPLTVRKDDDGDDGDDDGPVDPVEIVERVFRGRRVTERGTNGGSDEL